MKTLRTWDNDKRCAECCNGDRCDDPSHYDRSICPHCKGTGWALWTGVGRQDYGAYLARGGASEAQVMTALTELGYPPVAIKHTAEPWRAGAGTGGKGSIVADEAVPEMNGSDAIDYYGGHLIAESMVPRNIRRAVACVNACRGIPIEVLEANASGGLTYLVADQIDARVERSKLIALLRELVDIEGPQPGNSAWGDKVLAALAEVSADT